MQYYIEFSGVYTRTNIHRLIKESGIWYEGDNLDALYDALTSICEECEIFVSLGGDISDDLFEYVESTLDTFRDAADENSYISLTIE